MELSGFEPLTPSMPLRCATNCAITPKFQCSKLFGLLVSSFICLFCDYTLIYVNSVKKVILRNIKQQINLDTDKPKQKK